MGKKVFVMCLVLMACTSAASAAPYLGLGGMGVFLNDSDVAYSSTKISFDTGWGGIFTVGYEGKFFRIEGEIAYRRSEIDEGEVEGFGGRRFIVPIGGDVQVRSGMINTYIQAGSDGARPFIGAGVGGARIDVDSADLGDDQDRVFAYQGMIGVSIPADGAMFDLGYRYFATEDPEFDDGLEGEYKSHNIYAALRF